MRTTVRIDDDLLDRLKARANAEHTSLARLVNRVIRAGLAAADTAADRPVHVEETFAMGDPEVDVTQALAMAASIEELEAVRKLKLRK